MKKLIVIPAVGVGILAAGGVAWAILGGTVTAADIAQGIASGGGSNSCQTGGLSFTVPAPTWSDSDGNYMVSTIDYSNLSSACVNLGTADIVLNLTASGNSGPSIASGTETDAQASTGTINLSTPLSYDAAQSATYRYLVENS
jgi:hypothetical protein